MKPSCLFFCKKAGGFIETRLKRMREVLTPDLMKRGKRSRKSVVDQEVEPSPPKVIRCNNEDMEFKVYAFVNFIS